MLPIRQLFRFVFFVKQFMKKPLEIDLYFSNSEIIWAILFPIWKKVTAAIDIYARYLYTLNINH